MPERSKVVEVYVDAAVHGRSTGLGVYIPAWTFRPDLDFSQERPFQTGMGLRGRDSITKSEIQALLFGMDTVTSLLEAVVTIPSRKTISIEFKTDAKVITDVLNSFARMRTAALRKLFKHVTDTLEDLRGEFKAASVSYVGTRNNLADGMAKAAAVAWNERWIKS